MFKNILEILIYLLAVYGALALSHLALNSLLQRSKPEKSNIKLVLMLKDQEDAVEGIVRSMLSGSLVRKVINSGKVTVLDMGSKDDTWKILNKLKSDYEQLELVKPSEKDKIFDEFYIERAKEFS